MIVNPIRAPANPDTPIASNRPLPKPLREAAPERLT
jgi:hypothetical protein